MTPCPGTVLNGIDLRKSLQLHPVKCQCCASHAWPAPKHDRLAAAAGGTWAVGVGVAQDGGGGAVQVGVHVQVARAQVALHQQLVLLRVPPAHHQIAASRCCSF